MYTVSRKNGFTLKAETRLGARKALEQLFKCNAEMAFVTTPGGEEYVVTWKGGKERWYKRTSPILHQAPATYVADHVMVEEITQEGNERKVLCVYPRRKNCTKCQVYGHCTGKGKYAIA